MFRNYLVTAYRNLIRNKTYSIVNIAGLAIGIASALLIFIVVRFETSFDNFHPDHKRIFRLGSEFHTQDGISYSSGVPFPVAEALRIDYPRLEEVATIYGVGDGIISIPEESKKVPRKFQESQVYFAEPGFFRMFRFAWLSGDPATALSNPETVVLSRSVADKYYGDWHSAMGKTIVLDNKLLLKISGILEDIPVNSDFPLQVVISFSTLKQTNDAGNLTSWVSVLSQAYTFVKLPPGYPPADFKQELDVFNKKHRPAENAKDGFVIQPLSEIHFDDRFGNFSRKTFSHELITAISLIGIFLVLIACINFINMATARAVNRSREVGVRKVLGSNRRQLTWQFLGETALITLLAILVAIALSVAVLPLLNGILMQKLSFSLNQELLIFLLVVFFGVTLLSGVYPAIILSGFNPITALKNKITGKSVGGISLRRALVIFQFGIAQVLIIGMLVVVKQTDFFRNASLGFDKSAILNIDIPGDSASQNQMTYLKNRLLRDPMVQNVSFSFASPADNGNWQSDFRYDHAEKNTNFSANLKWADVDYFKTYQLSFVAGRPYYPSDTTREFVVNETLLRKLGVTNPQDALGKQLDFWDGELVGPVVGIVRDFNSYSLREPLAPVVLGARKDTYRIMNVKLKPGNIKPVMSFIEKIWNEAFPSYVYRYVFLDKKVDDFYRQENQLSRLYRLFAAIAIFISCLGLYGLVSFMAIQRVKEVGIRKVLGASAGNIVYLFSREFTLLILAAFAVSAPVAWFIMHQWLNGFSYRIELSIGFFLVSVAGSILIAWITVGYRAIRAAVANPVQSIRSE